MIARGLGPCIAVAGVLAACTAPHPVEPLPPEAPRAGPVADDDPDRLLVASFSGGGTRAAALAQGALAALEATPLAGGRTMLDEIDIVSSTSGGSVTAANFAARGADSFPAFQRDFLRYPFMSRLKLALLNPVSFVDNVLIENDRIEPLVDVFEERVFGDATIADAQTRPGAPYLVLNTTDAGSGITFPITQFYFDLICGDVRPYPLARAVAASAAYPVALSAVTLANRCRPAGPADPAEQALWSVEQHLPNPEAGPSDASGDAAARALALRAKALLDGEVDYLHLFDGGISDNMGLSEPLRLLTSDFPGNPYPTALRRADTLAILSVDARSGGDASYDHEEAPPNMVEALLAVTGGAIGSRMSGLAAQAAGFRSVATEINQERCVDRVADAPDFEAAYGACILGGDGLLRHLFIPVSFNSITDRACRAAFAEVPTNWALEPEVVSSLLLLGEGLVLSHPQSAKLAARSGAPPDPAALRRRGEALVEAACDCIREDGRCTAGGA
ncbi:MAG TPA: patatin-like phospholipase family protein [Thermohalobaculum sp.]|nr:patatin-like phospholipase family protein [Thermohalobaculum sp.]